MKNRIIARFIGKNGSMGFNNGRIYNLRSEVKVLSRQGKTVGFIFIYDLNSERRYCPYESLEAFLNNWDIIDY